MPASSLLIGFAAALSGAAAAAQTVDGAGVYKRCAACHLSTGQGVPGAFPPLGRQLGAMAARPAGREYLVLVVATGLTGEITVAGRVYRGFMPAQGGLGDAEIASVLNHAVTKWGGLPPRQWVLFSADEVKGIRARRAKLRAADVHQLRAQAVDARKPEP